METITINHVGEWKEELTLILSQHIYKQNGTLKKIQRIAEQLVHSVMKYGISYREYLEERENNLYDHLIYTAILSVEAGLQLGLSKERLEILSFGCLIHDIGLRYINVEYENCELDEMTPRELFELKNHTILGYTSLEDENWIPDIVKYMVLSHHEFMDGSGYPLKQKNKEIECKIIQICDSVDRIISGIECKQGNVEDAINEIILYKNLKYDGKIADIVMELVE